MENKENLVKKTCKELGITQRKLAEMMGVTPHTVTEWVRGNRSIIHEFALNGLISEKKYQNLREILKDVSNNTF